MTIQQFVDEKLVRILDKYSIPGQEVGSSLKEAIFRSDNKELIIPVLGMQGMGKSTLINAILKEDIMPSEADETTCVPVEVKYGETELAEVYFISNTKKEIVHTKKELYEEAVKMRREYQREWRAKNKDKVAANNRRYWERKALARKAAEQEAN